MRILDEAIEESEDDDFRLLEPVKDILALIIWRWFEANLDRKLTTIKLFWILKKSIYVRDLRDIFTLLFGPQTNGLSAGDTSQ
jgi:hypothetical protein